MIKTIEISIQIATVSILMHRAHLQSANRVVPRQMYYSLKMQTNLMQNFNISPSVRGTLRRTFKLYLNFRIKRLKIKFNHFKILIYTQLHSIPKIISNNPTKTISSQISAHLRNHTTRVSFQDSTNTGWK